ncbi:TRAP transporter large permease subunit [Intestinibacillus sp. Marseille-P6563]|uniref:TRAP transporter large permease subunit n=1 Tax=Intestinibacillus sp. Marseille-P6563 TaxID=2364792 RepID=UPI000F04FB8D|nr:TRAP transporter large permease subunit [Intestinibacillus sp. Marseille-P6563]
MLKVVIPMAVLLIIVLCKKIPVIGGKINVALVVTGALTLLLGGLYNPGQWVAAWIDGLDRLSWIIALSIAGSLFAEISIRLGTIDTIIGALTAKFGRHPRMLIICILFALTLAGSLLGDAIAASTVIGMLTIGILVSMNMSYEKISAIIVMGACVGSIMPPMTQALALASSLVGTPADPVINLGYVTVSISFIVVAIYSAFFLVHKDNVPGANPEVQIRFADQSASSILRANWKSLIPLLFLIVVVLLRTVEIPYLSVDLGPSILQSIRFLTLEDGTVLSLYDLLSGMSIVNGLTNGIVLSILCAIAVAFFFPVINKNAANICKESFSKVKMTVVLQICCAFMLGSFYAAGSVDAVSEFAQGLNGNVLKIGGAAAMILLGMLTGSQSTTQNVVFSFFGPALVAFGVNPTYAAVAGAHLATAGQGLPPADLTTFVVVGIVASQFGKKVDPLKSMFYSMPMCICMMLVGLFFLYI